MTKKNLAILFCSFRPHQYPALVGTGREKEYHMCIAHMLEVIPLDRFDVVVVDNTVGSIDGVTNSDLSKLLLEDDRITDVFFLQENIGSKNKGLGEIHMLSSVLEQIPVGKYKNIAYVTARKIVTNPYIFEKTDSMLKEALLSNPDIRYLTGKLLPASPGAFNDMFFAMSDRLMRSYAAYSMSRTEHNLRQSIGSEQNLFQFVSENNVEYEWLKWLGIVRNDWMLDYEQTNIQNMHIC